MKISGYFKNSSAIPIDKTFFNQYMIHQTSRGEMVRCRSDVIIADRLSDLGVEYQYEHPFTILGLTICPKFTIEDIKSGGIFYWEHNRISDIVGYDISWKRHIDSYRAVGILPYEDGGGEIGALIVTSELPPKKGISSQEIERIIRDVILK